MTNMTVNNGRFVWYEQLAKDPKKAIDFYTHVVGWKTEPFKKAKIMRCGLASRARSAV